VRRPSASPTPKAKLPDGQQSSTRIQRPYRKRSRRRDHALKALLRDLVEATPRRRHRNHLPRQSHRHSRRILVGRGELKARTFWAHRQCLDQLANVCEEYGIDVAATSEAWTSQTCPECGEREQTRRHRETLTCPCGFEGTPTRRRVPDATRTGDEHCGQADGTARAVPVGRPPVVLRLGRTRWLPTNSAQTRKVPPWCCRDTSERTLRGFGGGCRSAGRSLFQLLAHSVPLFLGVVWPEFGS